MVELGKARSWGVTALTGAVCAAAAFVAGIVVGSPSERSVPKAAPTRASADLVSDDMSAGSDAAEIRQRDLNQAIDNLHTPPPAAAIARDPQLEMVGRQTVELNEMICKQTGQNCELAKMARRQINERYGAR